MLTLVVLALSFVVLSIIAFFRWRGSREGKSELILRATINNDLNQLRQLLDKGISPNVMTQEGWTPLMLAASNGNEDAVEMLISKGADVTAADSEGKSAFDHALENGHREIADMLYRKLMKV